MLKYRQQFHSGSVADVTDSSQVASQEQIRKMKNKVATENEPFTVVSRLFA